MDLVALSERYAHFYVPAFAVKVAGADVLRDHAIAVTQAEVDLPLGAAGRFSFTVPNAFDPESREFESPDKTKLLEMLSFGAPVTIAMGYGDASSLPVLITGMITEVTTSFNDGGGAEMTVSGYDKAFALTGGKYTRAWTKARDSQAIVDIAGFNGLDPDVTRTEEELSQIEQNQESDLEFVKKLAERNGCEFYVTGTKLHFGPPQNKGDGVAELEWGRGLLSFKPEGNLAGQVSSIEVHGWDPKAKAEIVGIAKHGDEPGRDARAESAGDQLSKVLRQQPVLTLRQPVFSQADATSRAKALLKAKAEQFLKGEGETIGLPELLPDRNITLKGLGERFSKTYYMEQTVHRFDAGGYRTRFKVKETTL
jgi:phage protein D